MIKFRFFLCVITIFLSFNTIAQHIQLGSGAATTNRVPLNYYWDYNYTQTIYTAEEILFAGANSNGGSITKIRYRPTEPVSTDNWRRVNIYMGNTSKIGFDSLNDWIPVSNMVKVFDGYLANNTVAHQWLEIELDLPFVWNSSKNLVIAVNEFSPGAGGAPNWSAYTLNPSSGAKAIYSISSSFPIAPNSPPQANGTTNTVAQIQLVGESLLAPCMPPTNILISEVTYNSVLLNWNSPYFPPINGYDVFYSTSLVVPDDYTTPILTTPSGITAFMVQGLSQNETYHIWLRSNCGINGVSGWRGPITITTPCVPYTVPYSEDFEIGYIHDQNIGACIVQESYAGSSKWKANNYYTSYNRSPRVGEWNAYLLRSNSKWMFIPIELNASQNYFISLFARQDANQGAKITIKYGKINTPQAMTTTILENAEVVNGEYQEIFAGFSVPDDGIYYIGILTEVNAIPWYVSIDDIIIDYYPTCWKPSGLQVSDITTSSAVVSWNESVSNPLNGYDIFVTESSQKPFGSQTPTSSVLSGATSCILNNLNNNTKYYVWVRSNCGVNDESFWAGPIVFTTEYLCPTTYLEEFNNLETPQAYTLNSWQIGSLRGVTGNPPNNVFVNLNSVNTSDWFSTCNIAPITNGMALKFDYKTSNFNQPYTGVPESSGNLSVMVSTDMGNTYTQLANFNNSNSASYQHISIDLHDYIGQIVKFKFIGTRNSGNYDLAIDNIFVGDSIICSVPTNLSVTNLSSSSATLNWTHSANSFVVEWGTFGFEQGNGTFEIVNGNNFILNGLVANTKYEFYVRAVCYDIFDSDWAGPFSFTTNCNVYTIPYFEGFENGYTHNQTIATCLSQESSVGNNKFFANNAFTTYNRTPRTGIWNACLLYANTTWLFIPIQLNQGELYNIKLYARQDASVGAQVSIKYGTSNSASAMTSTIIDNFAVVNGNYQKITSNFSVPVSGVYYIGIKANLGSAPYYLSIDDISIDIAPTCGVPENFNISSIGANNALIKWTEPNGTLPDSYDVYYSKINLAPTASSTPNINVPSGSISCNLSGLENSTTYYVWIRSNCGSGNYSEWVGAITFSTSCTIAAIPIVENFETSIVPQLPDCTNAMNLSGNNWITTNNPGYGFSSKTLKYEHNGNQADAWFFTKAVQLSAETNYVISFEYGNSGEHTESIKLACGTINDANSMNTIIAQVSNFNSTTPAVLTSYFTPSESGVYYFGFNCYSAASNQGAVFIDNIKIDITPSCSNPIIVSANNITSNSANIYWTQSLSIFQVEWGPSMFEHGTGNLITVYDNSLLLDNLNYGTSYDVYVRRVCASGEYGNWSTKKMFTTSCPTNPLPLPYSDDFEGMFCWTVLDVDGDGNSWNFGIAQNHTPNGYLSAGHGLYIGAQEGWLISVPLEIPANRTTELSFWSKLDYPTDIGENTVLISSDNFVNIIDSVWTELNPSATWVQSVVDLSQYAGQTVEIAFRYKGNLAHRWWLDDIVVNMVSSARLNPSYLEFNLAAPNNLSTNITWNEASSIISIVDNQQPNYNLVQGIDYELSGNNLIILMPYLLQRLHNTNDQIQLTVNFNNSSEIFNIKAVGSFVFVDATINPNVLEYDLENPSNVLTTIEWNDATQIISIVDNQTQAHTLISPNDYQLNNNNLIIFKSYLLNLLLYAEDEVELTITFNHGVVILKIVAIGAPNFIDATITPSSAVYDLGNPSNVSTNIIWNDANVILQIIDNQDEAYILQNNIDYILQGNTITVMSSYLSNVLHQSGDSINLSISFDHGVAYFNIEAVGTPVYVGATVNPDILYFDVTNPENLFTFINWNDATQILSIVDNQNPNYTLLANGDYALSSNMLIISSLYVSSILTEVGESIVLHINFDHGEAELTITTLGEPVYENATINPDTLFYNLLNPLDITTEITWNDATQIYQIVNELNVADPLVEAQDYILDGNLLSILNAYLETYLHNSGDEINLYIEFDHGLALLNITATTDTYIFTKEIILKVYPNPSSGKFVVETNQEFNLDIVDISGRKILETKTKTSSNIININNCVPGVYFLNVRNNNLFKTIRIVLE